MPLSTLADPIPPATAAALSAAGWRDPRSLMLPPSLPRDVYESCDTLLTRLGGTWARHAGAHVFDYDAQPRLTATLAHGVMPLDETKLRAFFPTPAPIARAVVAASPLHDLLHLATPERPLRILEPSAGAGALAQAIRDQLPPDLPVVLDCLDVHPGAVAVLRAQGFRAEQADFLAWQPEATYDLIVMNPPFSAPGRPFAWADHLRHAHGMLSPIGEGVAVLPATAALGEPGQAALRHRQFLAEHGPAMDVVIELVAVRVGTLALRREQRGERHASRPPARAPRGDGPGDPPRADGAGARGRADDGARRLHRRPRRRAA